MTIQAAILNLLKDLQRELGMGLLLITHDLGIVRSMADRVCVMTQGRIVESGLCDDVFKTPQHEYTQRLLEAEPSGSPAQASAEETKLLQTNALSVSYKTSRGWFGH